MLQCPVHLHGVTHQGKLTMQIAIRNNRRAFSLIELVIVIVILGIIAAIAVPRMSRGATGAADSALTSNLAVLRNAIGLYEAEHQGSFPLVAKFAEQLGQYTDASGSVSATRTGEFIFGPYLRAVPPQPVGNRRGQTGVAGADAATIGWIYNETTGVIRANATGTDARGVNYSDY